MTSIDDEQRTTKPLPQSTTFKPTHPSKRPPQGEILFSLISTYCFMYSEPPTTKQPATRPLGKAIFTCTCGQGSTILCGVTMIEAYRNSNAPNDWYFDG